MTESQTSQENAPVSTGTPFTSGQEFIDYVTEGMSSGWHRLEKDAKKQREKMTSEGKTEEEINEVVSLQAKVSERLGVSVPAKKLQEMVKSFPQLKGIKRKGAKRKARKTRQSVTFFVEGAVGVPSATVETTPTPVVTEEVATPPVVETPTPAAQTGGFFGS